MNELIQQARELCDAATPGPWRVENGSDVFTELGADNGNGAHAEQNDAWHIADCDPASGTEWCVDVDSDGAINWAALKSHSNAAFIAASRTLVPQMCDALEVATARAEKAEAENRWIPVSEGLPEKLGRYLTVYISTTYKGNKPQKHVSELDWAGYKCGWLINGFYTVTHWCPLPDPPKGE